MSLSGKTTDELVKIARAGGGLVLEGGKRTADELAWIPMEGNAPNATLAKMVFTGPIATAWR